MTPAETATIPDDPGRPASVVSTPRVSVIISTFLRPAMVPRAVRSALAQTMSSIEVIVVVDGVDEATIDALRTIGDPRLRTIVPRRHLGHAAAGNAGVMAALADWVAFLDDDDVWMPRKLELQLEAAARCTRRYPIVACRMIGHSEDGDTIRPRRLPREDEPMSEYLFCRRTPFDGEGAIITSVILTSRALLRDVPFDETLPRLVDCDWLLRASRMPEVGVAFPDEQEPLATWNMERGRSRITNTKDWRWMREYGRSHRALFTRRGYAAFLLHVVSSNAALQRAWGAWLPLLWDALREGRPSMVDVASHAANFALPDTALRRGAAAFARLWNSLRRGATLEELAEP